MEMERLRQFNKSESTPAHTRPALLLCEADDTLRDVLATLVFADDYEVIAVSRLDECLAELARRTPSLLVLDVDGQPETYETFPELRRLCGAAPVLLLAGYFTLAQQQDALTRLASVRFVTKPFSPQQVLEKADTLIRGYSVSPIKRRVVRIAT